MNSLAHPPILFKTSRNTALAGIAFMFICSSTQASETNTCRDTENSSIKKAEAVSTNSTAAALPKLVDLGAKKCIPCKKLAPILEELKKEYAGVLTVEFIDVWLPENSSKAEKYGIDTIPTQIFFDPQGKELWRHEGFISREDILAKWKKLGYDLHSKNEDTEKMNSLKANKQ